MHLLKVYIYKIDNKKYLIQIKYRNTLDDSDWEEIETH